MSTLRIAVAHWCRQTRIALGITLQELADAADVSRSHLADIEAGLANPTLDVIDRLGAALDTDFEVIGRVPILLGGAPQERDGLHGWCSG